MVPRTVRSTFSTALLAAAVLAPLGVAAQADEAPRPESPPDSTGFVQTPTGGLYFESFAVGTPVVLLHGYAAQWRSSQWRHLLGDLIADHRIIGVDVRGHGRSAKPHNEEAYGIELARDVLSVMDGLGVEAAHLVGYSMGGIIALKAAAEYPDRVLSTTLIGQGWLAESELERMSARAPQLRDIDPDTLSGTALEGYRRNDVDALAALVAAYPGLLVPEGDVGSISGPLLAVVGSEDPRLARAEALKSLRSDVRLRVLDGRTHGSVVDDPAYAHEIGRFVRRVRGRARPH